MEAFSTFHVLTDEVGNELRVDDKFCDPGELRLVVNGQEFFLDSEVREGLARVLEEGLGA